MFLLLAFVAALFVIVLPQALFRRNEAAIAVFVAWCIGQVAYTAGLPEPVSQTIIYGMAFAILAVRVILAPEGWSWRCLGVAGLFLPLFAVCLRWALGAPEPYWEIYWTGVAQMALLSRPVVWLRTAHRRFVQRRQAWDDHFSMASL